jgi:hypothetical protein
VSRELTHEEFLGSGGSKRSGCSVVTRCGSLRTAQFLGWPVLIDISSLDVAHTSPPGSHDAL